jgi:hypothetical protein
MWPPERPPGDPPDGGALPEPRFRDDWFEHWNFPGEFNVCAFA